MFTLLIFRLPSALMFFRNNAHWPVGQTVSYSPFHLFACRSLLLPTAVQAQSYCGVEKKFVLIFKFSRTYRILISQLFNYKHKHKVYISRIRLHNKTLRQTLCEPLIKVSLYLARQRL